MFVVIIVMTVFPVMIVFPVMPVLLASLYPEWFVSGKMSQGVRHPCLIVPRPHPQIAKGLLAVKLMSRAQYTVSAMQAGMWLGFLLTSVVPLLIKGKSVIDSCSPCIPTIVNCLVVGG